MNHMNIERELVDYIHVTQDKIKRLAPENAVLIRLIPFMWETSWGFETPAFTEAVPWCTYRSSCRKVVDRHLKN
jgi:hypothetical protein